MGIWLKSVVWNFVLVAVAAVSMSYVLLDGFYVDPSLQYSVFPAIIVIVCLAALYFIARSRRTMLIGGILYAVALFVVWIISAVMTPDFAIFSDFEGNYLIYTMIITLTATACFLASRVSWGTAVMFIVGVFLLGLIQLFYERFELVWTILFVLSSLALLIYENYQHSMRTAVAVKKPSFIPGFVVSICACAVAVGLGVGIWYGIIAPLDPDALDIKLITEYRALETVQVRGTSDMYQTPNIDMTSDELNEGERTTDDIKEDVNGNPWPATGNTEPEPEDNQDNDSFMGMNLESIQDVFDLQSNPQNWPILVLLLLIVLAIVLYFILRRVRRNRRLTRFEDLSPDGEYQATFLFLLDRFRRVGVAIPKGQTMREFAVSSATAVRYQDEVAGVKFADLANSYSDMTYGNRDVSDEDVSKIQKYYSSFWKGCRKQLGNIRYFFKSFRL